MGQAEEYINKIPMWAAKKHSLADVRLFLEEMGNPDRRLPAIHVAGTNGKGSVCAFLTSLLTEAGVCTGTFISPHLKTLRERFLINGVMVEEAPFEEAFKRVLDTAKKLEPQGICHPTFFEFLFYMAMELFEKQGAEVMVVETGLGGRLDATNVLEKPLACAITSISLDHTQYLGDTIEAIAGEKAGIIKPGVPVIFDDTVKEASQVILRTAKERGAPVFGVGKADYMTEKIRDGSMEIQGKLLSGAALPLKIPFEASYQCQNAMMAVRIMEVLAQRENRSISGEWLQKGIFHAKWPGRMEEARRDVFLDGAHNPGGIRAFVKTADDICARRKKKAFLLFAAVSDKEYGEMAELLCEGLSFEAIGVVQMESSRGLKAQQLAELFKEKADCPVRAYRCAEEGFSDMEQLARGELLFCVGSLYLIGELKAFLEKGVNVHD